MKNIFIVLLVAVASLAMPNQVQAQNDAISKYFDKYMDDESFTVVYISSRMFEMFAKIDPDVDEEVKEVIRDLKGLRILVREDGGLKYYKEAIKKIDFNEYEELMTVRDDGTNVKFVVREEGDIIKELLLIVGGADEFVLMSFIGIIDLAKISKLAKDMEIDIDGLEHLEKIDEEDNND
jgi:hypothetical protein